MSADNRQAYQLPTSSLTVDHTCARWNTCISILLLSVVLEVLFVILVAVHLSVVYHGTGGIPHGAGYPQMRGGIPGLHPIHHAFGEQKGLGKDSLPASMEDLTADQFLQKYDTECNKTFGAHTSTLVEGTWGLAPCSCVPDTLVGRLNVTFRAPQFGEMELEHRELRPGGHWQPDDCLPRHRTAIIVPFRDREEHLRIFLNHIHPLLQNQKLHYRVIVVEQRSPEIFNKASMMNIGFLEARKLEKFDCFIFHDVDMLAEDDRNFYTCSRTPRHVASHCDKWNYQVPYKGIFGGATAFTSSQFELANGFSNQFYGWGGEDDDMYNRLVATKQQLVRNPGSVARYTMIKHHADRRNPYNRNSGVGFGFRPHIYKRDGLNTLQYERKSMEQRPLYTWISATVPSPEGMDQFRSRHSSAPAGAVHRPEYTQLLVTTILMIYWWCTQNTLTS